MCLASKMPAISSKVRTKSTSLRTLLRMASSFLAAQGPMNTILPLGWSCLMSRAVRVMGVRAMEMQLAWSGKVFLAMTDQAGQQEVPMKGISSGTSFTKSSASWVAQRSAPMATSKISAKPRAFMAARSLPGVTLGPNWPTKAGATAAYTRSPDWMARMTWKIWDLSAMAPKGQFTRHMPQETHFSGSISALPLASVPMASTPQATAQGRSWMMMAL